jgi:hypothetical protein
VTNFPGIPYSMRPILYLTHRCKQLEDLRGRSVRLLSNVWWEGPLGSQHFEEGNTIVVFITLITFLFTSLDPIFSEP